MSKEKRRHVLPFPLPWSPKHRLSWGERQKVGDQRLEAIHCSVNAQSHFWSGPQESPIFSEIAQNVSNFEPAGYRIHPRLSGALRNGLSWKILAEAGRKAPNKGGELVVHSVDLSE